MLGMGCAVHLKEKRRTSRGPEVTQTSLALRHKTGLVSPHPFFLTHLGREFFDNKETLNS